jgi:hypothetical protein
MSLLAAIATVVALDVALIGFVAWMMSHPRHLSPHAPVRDTTTSEQTEAQLVS